MSDANSPEQTIGSARGFQWLYNRTPRGIARICVAGLAGALCLFTGVAGRDGTLAREYWPWLGGAGLAIGLLGGSILGVLEHRDKLGQRPPLWLIILGRIGKTFLFLSFFGLLLVLGYCMLLVLEMNHRFDDSPGAGHHVVTHKK